MLAHVRYCALYGLMSDIAPLPIRVESRHRPYQCAGALADAPAELSCQSSEHHGAHISEKATTMHA
jgi:hypothetical protein